MFITVYPIIVTPPVAIHK